jgi:hypothetical protein
MKKFINLFWKILLILSILSFSSEAAKDKKKDKDDGKPKCVYCEKYKKLKDWPENERPIAFIYEKVDYPEGMFNEKVIKKVISEKLQAKERQGRAGRKVYHRFVKSKSTLNKYQHLMIRDMAYFEALYNEMLMDPDAKVETLESLKKGREAMRMSLKISPKASTSEAVLKFWATGKMMKITYFKNKKKKKKKKKKQKIDPETAEIAERAAVLASLKQQIALAKTNAQRAATLKAQEKIEAK